MRIVAMPIDSASRGTALRRPSNSGAFARRVAALSRVRCVCAFNASARFVEADVPVGAEAEHLQIDAAGATDRPLVTRALADQRRASIHSETASVAAAD